MSAARTVVSNGYVALDVICHEGSVRQRAGGTAANVAANLAYLGWSSSVLGRIGADAPGRRLVSDLENAGVETAALELDRDLGTPVVVHEVTPPQHRFSFKCPVCGRKSPRFRAIDNEDGEATSDRSPSGDAVDVFFVDRASSFSVGKMEQLSAAGALTVFEPSSRGVEHLCRRAAESAEIVKWSHELRGSLHRVVFEPRQGQLQIETLGEDGLRFRIGRSGWQELAAPDVEAVDGAGAGDWLTAAFLDSLEPLTLESLSKNDLGDALGAAQVVAALSCCYVGARALAEVPRKALDQMRRDVQEANSLVLPPVGNGRRSRAKNVCRLCLGTQRPA